MSFAFFDLELFFTDVAGEIPKVGYVVEAVKLEWFHIFKNLHCFKLPETAKDRNFAFINWWK